MYVWAECTINDCWEHDFACTSSLSVRINKARVENIYDTAIRIPNM